MSFLSAPWRSFEYDEKDLLDAEGMRFLVEGAIKGIEKDHALFSDHVKDFLLGYIDSKQKYVRLPGFCPSHASAT